MNKQLRDKIDNYLFDLLSEEERIAFEQEMREDAKLRNEVELTRQIMEGFQIKGEQEALKEMQQISSADELRSMLKEVEKKYHPVETLPSTKTPNLRFYLGLAAGIAATVLLVVVFNYFRSPDQLISELNLKNEELNRENLFLQDSLFAQKAINETQFAEINSLRKLKTQDSPVSTYTSDLLAMLTVHDQQTKGSGQTLRFNLSQINRDPAGFRVEWTPINARGDIYLYMHNERKEKEPVPNGKFPDYDLSKGFYQLKGLKSNTLYFFEIKTDNRNEPYRFPFMTK